MVTNHRSIRQQLTSRFEWFHTIQRTNYSGHNDEVGLKIWCNNIPTVGFEGWTEHFRHMFENTVGNQDWLVALDTMARSSRDHEALAY